MGGPGLRRGLRRDPPPGSSLPGVTLDDIYARHTPIAWWDGSHGVNVGAGTWTDRVSGIVITAATSIASGTLGGQAAAVLAGGTDGASSAAGVALLGLSTFRIFYVFASGALTGAYYAPYYIQTGGDGVWFWNRDAGGTMSGVGDGVDYSTRNPPGAFDYGDDEPHIFDQHYNGTHASHRAWVDGAEVTDAGWSSSDVAMAGADGQLFLGTDVGITQTCVMFAIYAHGAMNDTEAAQVRADLLTLMGL